MPKGRGQPPRTVPPGTTFASLVVVREVERSGYNRRFECRCTGCGTVGVKWLSNLLQGKTSCLVCVPMAERNRAGRDAILATRRGTSQESDTGRICLTCGQWKPWDKFSDDPRRARGKTSNCMECAYWRTIKATYGLTRSEWNWLHERQQGRCALCGENGGRRLAVDHDHSCCGRSKACKSCIRGLLCSACNRAILGHVERRPLLRARFADYLDQRPFSVADHSARYHQHALYALRSQVSSQERDELIGAIKESRSRNDTADAPAGTPR